MKPVPIELCSTITEDYNRLCDRLGLARVPLDIFIYDEESVEKTPFGFPINYPFPGYDQKVIHLPLYEVAIEGTGHSLDLFPANPGQWDLRSSEWPEWRASLWHETIHQYEDRVLGTWKSGNEHGVSWRQAVDNMATKLGISSNQLSNVTGGIVVPSVQARPRPGLQ